MSEDCTFCKIIHGQLPAEKVHEDGLLVGIRDVNPQAPVHILLMPRTHIPSAAGITEAHAFIISRLFAVAADLARVEELVDGWRLVTNVGQHGGQSVPHLHFHLLGGRQFGWPPG